MKRLRALTAAPFVLALTAQLLLSALWRDRLPDPLATHFSGTDGRPDGYTGRALFLAVGAGLVLALGAGWTLFARRRVLWGAWATAGFTGALLALLLRANLDAAQGADARYPLVDLALAALTAALAALAGLGLARLVPPEPAPPAVPAAGAPRIELAAGEVAGWSRVTGSRPLTALSAGFLLAGAAGLALAPLLGPWPYLLFGLVGLVVGAPGLACARVRVTVDRHGLTVAPAALPRPRIRIPLDDVAEAEAGTVNPLGDYGGWGYRTRPHRSALVLRSGEALVVRRRSGFEFAVTVPDAETAAALLNALATRPDGATGPERI
ncbi:hypothetical protein [Streptomyces sp. NPDC004267]|uniref:hypothetical protein n=1 Tax=Streptomyces sp. NPDC004267 TaxID=3364694 RepID=UPI0036BEAF4D